MDQRSPPHPLLEALKSLIEACFVASRAGLIDFHELDRVLETHTCYSHLAPRQRRRRART